MNYRRTIFTNLSENYLIKMLKKVGSFHSLLHINHIKTCLPTGQVCVSREGYSSSSKLIASRVEDSTSYSSLLPTIMLSNSF